MPTISGEYAFDMIELRSSHFSKRRLKEINQNVKQSRAFRCFAEIKLKSVLQTQASKVRV